MSTLHMLTGIRKTFPVKLISITVTWIFGLLAGVFFLSQTTFASLMCSVLFPRTSIFGLLISLAIPLFITYIFLKHFYFFCILPLIFLKAFSFICCYGGIMITFGNAGWLISGLVLLSDLFLVLLLLFLWFNAAIGQKYDSRKYIIAYFLMLLIVVCFDYLVVSPYVATLLNY